MAKTLQQSDGVISFDILVKGKNIKDTVEINEITVQMEVNRIAVATIIMEDGGAIGVDNAPFTNSEGNDFIPGNEIEISLGYDNKKNKVFKGIIVSQNLSVKKSRSHLIVTCKDLAVKMTKGRFNATFQNKKDSDALSSIAARYGLQTDIDATKAPLPVSMQYNCSDWDFMVVRAEMNNMSVLTDKGKLIIKKNDFKTSPKFEINASQIVIEIDLNLDCENIPDKYQLTAWDDKEQKEISESVTISDSLGQGNLNATKLAKAIDYKESNHYSSAKLTEYELKTWGESLANKAVLSKVQGKIIIQGNADIMAGDMIELSGFSARFNGKAYVSKTNHIVEDGSWITILQVGRPTHWHAALPDVEEASASGLIPSAKGTQIAKVKKIHEDPDGNYRVLVNLPAFSGTGQEDGIWARLVFPYATADAGFFFFPEIDDEVLLTFINNDPRYPVITGSLYNAKNKPKTTPDEKNQFKSIYSKSGINITFDDEDKILVVETPEGNTFTLSDKEKSIRIKDMNSNSLIMDDSGIVLDSPKDIKLSAKGDIDISATGGVKIKGNADIKVDGSNVELTAKVGVTAKGNASAELSASGQTTVKGSMVMIN
ncbi:type VI secretion system tip protein VgrG [Saccharicrinis sp. 156]|uniref:type VI secretion system tip protein VgrG n=1 Tax=Saccharicrinis sp. 156 TaxID=3417574 RepID=UPI003D355FFF